MDSFFSSESDCLILLLVTLSYLSSTAGVLLSKSSVSRDFNCEWPTQCEVLKLSLKQICSEDTQNGDFLDSPTQVYSSVSEISNHYNLD